MQIKKKKSCWINVIFTSSQQLKFLFSQDRHLSFTHNLVSGLAAVHQVGKQDGVFGARQAAGGHFTGAFLDGDSLVVLVNGLQQGDNLLTH